MLFCGLYGVFLLRAHFGTWLVLIIQPAHTLSQWCELVFSNKEKGLQHLSHSSLNVKILMTLIDCVLRCNCNRLVIPPSLCGLVTGLPDSDGKRSDFHFHSHKNSNVPSQNKATVCPGTHKAFPSRGTIKTNRENHCRCNVIEN